MTKTTLIHAPSPGTVTSEPLCSPEYSFHLSTIRGLAALVVFSGHLHLLVTGNTYVASAPQPTQNPVALPHVTQLGHAAVMVFFVLSGYMVGGHAIRDLNRGTFLWSNYLQRRLIRLWTVLIPALLFGGILDFVSYRFFGYTRAVGRGAFSTDFQHTLPCLPNFVTNLLFLQFVERVPHKVFGSNVALWSLSAEFWYYILFPLLLCTVTRSSSNAIRTAMGLLSLAVIMFVGAPILLLFPIWLLGVALYLIPAARSMTRSFILAASAVSSAMFLSVIYFVKKYPLPELASDWLIGCSFAAMVYFLLLLTKPVTRTSLYGRVARGLADPSYTLYAMHIPAILFLSALAEAHMPLLQAHIHLLIVSVGVATLAYCWFMYFLFERNTAAVGRFVGSAIDSYIHRFRRSTLPDVRG